MQECPDSLWRRAFRVRYRENVRDARRGRALPSRELRSRETRVAAVARVLFAVALCVSGVALALTAEAADGPREEKRRLARLEDLYRVTGIFHDESDQGLSAVVLVRARSPHAQRLYWVGDVLDGGVAKLVRVDPMQVYFEYLGRVVPLTLQRYEGAAGPSASDKGRSGVNVSGVAGSSSEPKDGDLRKPFLGTLNRLKSLVAVPQGRPRVGAQGFRVEGIKPGSLLSRLGLQDGDVVKMLNRSVVRRDLEVADLARALQLARGKAMLTVERDGKEITIDVRGRNLFKK